MNKFIVKILFFILQLVLVGCIGHLFLKLSCKKFPQNGLAIPENVTILFVGDSHIECGINDSIFPNGINLGRSAESYYYSYIKLRYILSKQPQIETVFISYSFYNLTKQIEKRWFSNMEHINSHFKYYISMIRLSELIDLVTTNYKGVSKTWFYTIKETFQNLIRLNTPNVLDNKIYGRYVKHAEDNIIKDIAVLDTTQFYDHPDFNVLSKIESKYLLKISTLCKKNDVELILINMPVHQKFKTIFEDNKIYYEFRENHLKCIKLLDYSDYQIPDDGYLNCSHLNIKGSNLFSQFLKSDLKNQKICNYSGVIL